METKNIMSDIQMNLKVPKGQMNKFGGYKYRSCEDIVEAVKPLLAKHGLYLAISDEIHLIGTRFYVKAIAKIMSNPGTFIASAWGWAREEETKKGMDASQITGAASSYARKYALNGLLGIDDTKDADTHENAPEAAIPLPGDKLIWIDAKPKAATNPIPKVVTTPAATTVNRKADPDTRPWLNEKQYKQALDKIPFDLSVYEKTIGMFKMKTEYKIGLEEVYKFNLALGEQII